MKSLGTGGFRMAALRVLAAIGLVLVSGAVSEVRAQAGRIYWNDSSGGTPSARVFRADLDGTHVQPLVGPPSFSPRFLALDVEGGKMYWTDVGVINRANLDGTGQITLINAGFCPMGIALDVPAGKIYWTDCVEGRIMRATLSDGSGVQEVVAGLGEPRGLALDLTHGKMYWTDTGSKKVQRSNLDGTNREDLVTDGLFPQGIALDVEAGTMYWPDNITIRRANLDGTAAATIVANAGNPIGIALDRAKRKLYWTENVSKTIQRANPDGTFIETVVSGGMTNPWGLALYQTSEIITGADAGGGSHVRDVRRNPEGSIGDLAGFFAYGSFAGGVRVAAGDVDGDGRLDIITGAGPGGGPHVRVIKRLSNGTLQDIAGLFAYDPSFAGGVTVAAGDVNGDGFAEIITGAGPGGGPHVRVFQNLFFGAIAELSGFFAYDPAFSGGVTVAAGDVDGDGQADVITGAGPGGGPHVRVLKINPHSSPTDLAGFFAYAPSFAGGVYVAAGDVDGDGLADIITGAGAGGGPHVRVFKRNANGSVSEITGFFAYAPAFAGGVRVAAADLDGDGRAEIITGAGPGGGPHVRAFKLNTNGLVTELTGFFAYSPDFSGGVFVASETPISPAVSIGFFGVLGHFVRFEGPYSQSGFTLNTTVGEWFSIRKIGILDGAYIYFRRQADEPTQTAEVRVTAAGSLFHFTSVDVSSNNTEIPYTITGLKDSSPVFTLTGTLANPSGQIVPVINPNASAMIDTLVISLSNPATPCCGNAVGIDKIAVRY